MLSKKMFIMALVGLLLLAVWGYQSREEILYAESFEDGSVIGEYKVHLLS